VAVPGRSKGRTAMRLEYFDVGLVDHVAAPGDGALRIPQGQFARRNLMKADGIKHGMG